MGTVCALQAVMHIPVHDCKKEEPVACLRRQENQHAFDLGPVVLMLYT